MPRSFRIFIPDVPVHLMNRGINRMDVFHDDADRTSFLAALKHASTQYQVSVHGFVVMTNHFHLVTTPPDRVSVPRMMKDLGVRYVRHYNGKYDRIGTVWNGRYKPKTIQDDPYALTCLLYVDQNPVRAGLVVRPEDYAWSSYSAHAWGRWLDWLTPHRSYLALGNTAEERQRVYRGLCGVPLSDELLASVRSTVPIGSIPTAAGEVVATRH
jgi:putative transposase